MPPEHARCSRLEAFYSRRGINPFSEIKKGGSNSCSGATALVGDQAGPQRRATGTHRMQLRRSSRPRSPRALLSLLTARFPLPAPETVLCSSPLRSSPLTPRWLFHLQEMDAPGPPITASLPSLTLQLLQAPVVGISGLGCCELVPEVKPQRQLCLDATLSARKPLPVSSGASPRAASAHPRYGVRPTTALPRLRHMPALAPQPPVVSYILISATT